MPTQETKKIKKIFSLTREQKIFTYVVTIYTLMAIIVSVFFYFHEKEHTLKNLDTQLLATSRTFNATIPQTLHFENNLSSHEYRLFVNKLNDLAQANHVTYIYSLIQKNGTVYFTTSSETPQDIANNDFTYFHEVYKDVPHAAIHAFITHKPQFSPLYTDRWGTFRSLFVPYTTPQGIFVVGVDIQADNVEQILHKSLLLSLGFSLMLLLPLIPAFIVYKRYMRVREEELLSKLYKNSVTLLPNKTSLSEELILVECHYAVMILRLDNYHYITSLYGFTMTDAILQEIGRLLKELIPSNATLFHIQDDQFAITLLNPTCDQEIDLAKQIRGFFINSSFSVHDLEIQVSFTMGIARGDDENVFKKADSALNKASQIGKNRYEVYNSQQMQNEHEAHEILEWISKVKKALTNESIIPYYQPIMNLKTGQIGHFECLSRLIDHDQILNPYLFMEPAKMAGFLPYLTKAIINAAFQFFSDKDYKFSINITAEDLQDDFFCQFLRLKLTRFHIAPERVTCEILEDIRLTDNDKIGETIKDIKKMGVKIAIDDFGTSYSNFSRLLEMEADYLKIDGAFIKNIDTDLNSQKIVASIVSFCKNAGIKTVAEFVHSKAIFDKLKEMDVDYVQGYFIGPPLRTIPL